MTILKAVFRDFRQPRAPVKLRLAAIRGGHVTQELFHSNGRQASRRTMAANDRHLRCITQMARATVNGREGAHILRYLYRVVGHERLEGARANGCANDTSKAQASTRLCSVDADLSRYLHDFANDGVAGGGVGVERIDLNFFRFFGGPLKVSIDHVGSGNVHPYVRRDPRTLRDIVHRSRSNDGTRAAFTVLTHREFVLYLNGVLVNGRACRFIIFVCCQRLLSSVFLRGLEGDLRVHHEVNDGSILLDRCLVSALVRVFLGAGIAVNGGTCRVSFVVCRQGAAGLMFDRRDRHVDCHEASLSDRQIVGRAIFDALRGDCLAYLLLGKRVLVGGSSAAFTNGNGDRLHFNGHVRNDDCGQSFWLGIS